VGVKHHEFLEAVHDVYRPRNYLEIGVDRGQSLALSRVPSIAIDPAFKITSELHCDLLLAKETSEEFFSRRDPVGHFREKAIDLAFIDGLHLFEVALLDFRNVERFATPTSVVILDDVLPRSVDEAARQRHTKMWTGDVFKVALVLERHRPDLVCIPLDTQPTGLLLVLALDPSNRLLDDRHDQVEQELASDDHEAVPRRILLRTDAADPEAVLRAGFWRALVELRDRSTPEAPATPTQVRERLDRDPAIRRWTHREVRLDGLRPSAAG
jgi:hypothetical protein